MEIVNGVPTVGGAVSVTAETLDPASGAMAEGFYEAGNLVDTEADLVAANIKKNVVIFGVTGTYDNSAVPITTGTVKTGLEGFVNGAKVTGAGTKTLNPANSVVAAGYYEATLLETVDTDLITDNIKSGTTIFGVAGKATVKDVSDTTAAAADVKAGTYFYTAAGVRTEGTLP
jgi:hypothetical protein